MIICDLHVIDALYNLNSSVFESSKLNGNLVTMKKYNL